MTKRIAVGGALLALVAWHPAAIAAQGPAPRLAGTVTTTGGIAYDGAIRWDANEAFPDDRIDAGLALQSGEERRGFGFRLFGFTIGGEPPPPPSRPISLPFGAIRRLDFDRPVVRATLVDGEELVLVPRGSDLGAGCRGVTVTTDAGDVELDCDDVATLALRPEAPASGPAGRLWGTVDAVDGTRRSGWIVWDRDESLAGDLLDGDDPEGTRHAVPIGTVRSIERLSDASRLVLSDGTELTLSGTNDVASGHRGVAVTIPGRGLAEIDWEDVRAVRFTEPPDGLAAPGFAGGRPAVARLYRGETEGPEGRLVWEGVPRYAFETIGGRAGPFVRSVPLERLTGFEVRAAGVLLRFRDGGSETLQAVEPSDGIVAVEQGERGTGSVRWAESTRVELAAE